MSDAWNVYELPCGAEVWSSGVQVHEGPPARIMWQRFALGASSPLQMGLASLLFEEIDDANRMAAEWARAALQVGAAEPLHKGTARK